MQESRLKWYEHVLRRDEECVGKRVKVMEVPGKRTRGRPKWRWLDNIWNDLSEREMSVHRPNVKVGKGAEEEATRVAH